MGLVITLVIAGIILLLAEIFLIPGVGAAGIFGLIALCGSSYYAFAVLSTTAGIVTTAVNIILISVLLFYALRAKTWKRLELDTVIDSKQEDETVGVGDKGKAITRLGPMGSARFNGKSYEVTALEGMIDAGSNIEAVHIENNKIYVKQVMPDEAF